MAVCAVWYGGPESSRPECGLVCLQLGVTGIKKKNLVFITDWKNISFNVWVLWETILFPLIWFACTYVHTRKCTCVCVSTYLFIFCFVFESKRQNQHMEAQAVLEFVALPQPSRILSSKVCATTLALVIVLKINSQRALFQCWPEIAKSQPIWQWPDGVIASNKSSLGGRGSERHCSLSWKAGMRRWAW